MTKERYNELMRTCIQTIQGEEPTEAALTQEEMDAGWHWCHAWDGLLVDWHDNEGEGRICDATCGSGMTDAQYAEKRRDIAAMPPDEPPIIDDEKVPEPKTSEELLFDDTVETLELTIRSARRCAYDLNHAANEVEDKEMRDLYLIRAKSYIKLFQSGNSCKDYRHHLHLTIYDLELKLDRLRKILEEHKIGDPTLF